MSCWVRLTRSKPPGAGAKKSPLSTEEPRPALLAGAFDIFARAQLRLPLIAQEVPLKKDR